MQALDSTTVFFCHAAQDRTLASQAADFLRKGTAIRVFLDEGELRPGENLAEKAREGRMAEVVLVFFSRNSLPSRWPRSEWEGALVNEPAAEGVRMAFLKCDDCIPPRVLPNQFDLVERRLDGLRGLKRWLRGGSGDSVAMNHEVEVVAMAVADRPGMEIVENLALAEETARACAADFDAILRVHCPGRTLTALASDLGWQLGLKLEGDLEANLERLESFCSDRRFLVILQAPEDAVAEALVFGGRCSTLISREAGIALADPLHEAQRALNGGTVDWIELCRHARLGRQITTNRGRVAECFELMQQWHAMAEKRGDGDAANEAAREMIWILESWGRNEDAQELEFQRASRYDEQLKLF